MSTKGGKGGKKGRTKVVGGLGSRDDDELALAQPRPEVGADGRGCTVSLTPVCLVVQTCAGARMQSSHENTTPRPRTLSVKWVVGSQVGR